MLDLLQSYSGCTLDRLEGLLAASRKEPKCEGRRGPALVLLSICVSWVMVIWVQGLIFSYSLIPWRFLEGGMMGVLAWPPDQSPPREPA